LVLRDDRVFGVAGVVAGEPAGEGGEQVDASAGAAAVGDGGEVEVPGGGVDLAALDGDEGPPVVVVAEGVLRGSGGQRHVGHRHEGPDDGEHEDDHARDGEGGGTARHAGKPM